MSITLSQKSSTTSVSGIYADPKFLEMQINYRQQVLDDGEFEILELKENQAYRHRGDFYRLLATLGVSPKTFWLTMHINKMTSPNDFDGVVKGNNLVVVKDSYIVSLANQYKNSILNVG